MLTYLGSVSVGAACPFAAPALGTVTADLAAQLDAIADTVAVLDVEPPGIFLQIAAAEAVLANLQAAAAAGITPPSVSLQVATFLSLLAEITVKLEGVAPLAGALLAFGVHLYAYDGIASLMGTEISAATSGGLPDLSGPTAPINALLLATSIPLTWVALSKVLKTTL